MHHNLPQAVLAHVAGAVYKVLVQVGKFRFVHAAGVAGKVPHPAGNVGIAHNGLVQPVNGRLRALHHVDHAKPRRAARHGEQHVKHKRVLAVVVIAPLGILRVVLAGIQNTLAHILAVMQHAPPLVIPVHNKAFVARVNALIILVSLRRQPLPQVVFGKRPLLQNHLVVHQLHMEHVPARLYVGNAGLPVQVQQVHQPQVNVAQAPVLGPVPKHTLHRRAVLQLVPPGVAVHLLVIVLVQRHRQYARKLLGRVGIILRAGQHVGLRVVVHRVGVLVRQAVEHPPAVRKVAVLRVAVQAVPVLVLHNAPVQRRLAALVLQQHLRRLAQLFGANGLRRLFLPRGLPALHILRGGHLPAAPRKGVPGSRLSSSHAVRWVHRHALLLSYFSRRKSRSMFSGSSPTGGSGSSCRGLMGFSISTYRHSS